MKNGTKWGQKTRVPRVSYRDGVPPSVLEVWGSVVTFSAGFGAAPHPIMSFSNMYYQYILEYLNINYV